MAEHPPECCRKFVGNRVLKLLDTIAAKDKSNREECR
jgi:hypothetical protein